MRIRSTYRVLIGALLLSASSSVAQTTPPQSSPASPCPAVNQFGSQNAGQSSKPCSPPAPDASKPSTSEEFPFPGEAPKPAATPDSPHPANTPGSIPSSAASEHPFPTQLPPKLPGDDSSSSSSSSSTDDPSAPPDTSMPPPGTEGSSVHRRLLPKVRHVQSDDERVDEDLKVARFYVNADNLPGAYLRAKDAVKTQPEYSDTHFALAQVAQKMKKKDEAIAEYRAYLKLDPDGEKATAAHRALEQLH